MRQFAVIKNADTDEIFAIAIKSEDNLIHCMGIHPAGRQWAKSYNQGLTKSLTDDLQPGIFTGDFAPLTSTMQAVIDEAMEGKSVRFPDRSRLVFFDSIDHRHTQVVPQIKDAGLHNLNLKDLKKGADYKGMTFRVDSARSSVLFKTRQGQYGYDIQGIGFISRKIDKKVLQEELTNTALGYGNVRRAVKAVAERKCIMLDGHDGYMPLDEEKFVAPVRTKANRLGRRLGGGGKGGVRKIGRSMKDPFDPKAWDGDGDGIVQEGTMWERPAIPGINTNLPGQPKTRTKPKDYPSDTQRDRKRRADAQKPRRDPNRYHPGAAGRARRRSRLDQRRRLEGAGMRSMYGNDPDAPFPTPAEENAFDAYMKRIDGMTVNELFDMDGISYPSDRLLGELVDEHGWDIEEGGADEHKPLSELLKEAGGVKTGSTASKLFTGLEDDFWDDPSKFMNIDEGPDPYDVWKDRQMDDDASGGMRSRTLPPSAHDDSAWYDDLLSRSRPRSLDDLTATERQEREEIEGILKNPDAGGTASGRRDMQVRLLELGGEDLTGRQEYLDHGGMRSQRGSSKPDPLWQGPDGDPYRAEQLEEVWQDQVNEIMDEQDLSEEDAIEELAANPPQGMRSFREFDRRARENAPYGTPEGDRERREGREEYERLVQFLMDDSTYMNPDGLSREEAVEELRRLGNNARVLGTGPGSPLGELRKRTAEKHRSDYGFHPAGNRYRPQLDRQQALENRFDHTSTDDMDTDLGDYYRRRDSETDDAKKARWQQEIDDHETELNRREGEDNYDDAARGERIERLNAELDAEDRGEERAAGGMRSMQEDYEPDPMDLAKANREDRLMREHTAHLTSDELIQLNETLADVLAVFEGSIYGPDEEDPDFARILKLKEAIEVALDAQDVIEIGDGMDIDDTIGTLLRVYDGVGEPWPEISDVISVLEMARDNRDGEYVSPTLTERGYMLSDEDRAVDGGMRSRRGGEPSRRETPRRQELRKMSVNELRDDDSVPDEALQPLENTVSGFDKDDPIFDQPIEDIIDNGEYYGPDDLERLLDTADPPLGRGLRSQRTDADAMLDILDAEPQRRYAELRKIDDKQIVAWAKAAGIYDHRKNITKLRRQLAGLSEPVPGNIDDKLQFPGGRAEWEKRNRVPHLTPGWRSDGMLPQRDRRRNSHGIAQQRGMRSQRFEPADPLYPAGRFDPDHWPTFGGDPRLNPDGSRRLQDDGRVLVDPREHLFKPGERMRSRSGSDLQPDVDYSGKKRVAREKRLQKEFEGVSDRDLEEELGELESADMLAEDDPNTLQDIKDRFGSLKKMQDRLNKLWEETDRRDAEKEERDAPSREEQLRQNRIAAGMPAEGLTPRRSQGGMRSRRDPGQTIGMNPFLEPGYDENRATRKRQKAELDQAWADVQAGRMTQEEYEQLSLAHMNEAFQSQIDKFHGLKISSRVDSQRARHAQRTGADDSNESYRWGGSPRPDSEEYERRVEQVQRGGMRARQRDATTDAAAMPRGRGGMRSRRRVNRGRNRPGVDRASEKDGQIWENLTPEERKAVVEAAKVEMHRLMWGLTWNDIGVNATRKSGDEGVSNIGNAVIRYWFNEHIRPGLSEEAAKNYVFTDENIEQIKSAIERNVSDGILKPMAAESMEKLLNRFDSLRTYRNMAEASEKDGDEAFAFLEHLSPSARDSLYKRAAGPDQDRLRKRAALRWNKNPSTRDESLESRQGEVGRLAGTRRGRVGSWTRDMAKRIMIPDPERARRRLLKAQKRRGGSGGGGTEQQRRRSAIERAMSKAKRKARSLLRGKKDEKKVLAEADKNMGHKIVKVDADGKVELGDIKQFSKALAAYRKDPGALKVKTKGSDGEAHGEDIAAERNADMGIIWQVHGMNGLPILVSQAEMEGLADEGWTMIVRGHGHGKGGVDNAENWLTDELRFLPGRGGEAYGSGEYWATGGGFASWRDAVDQNSTVALIPPTARRISQSDAHEQASANKRITEVFNLVASTYPGDEIEHADPKELAAQIRAEFDKADPRNWETEVGQLWQRLLEAMENGDPDSVNAMLMFKKISKADRNLIAPALGYDVIDVANGPTLVMNRSAMVALDGAVNEGQFQKLHRIAAQARADRRG